MARKKVRGCKFCRSPDEYKFWIDFSCPDCRRRHGLDRLTSELIAAGVRGDRLDEVVEAGGRKIIPVSVEGDDACRNCYGRGSRYEACRNAMQICEVCYGKGYLPG